eukprot:Awhi_evm1s4465
MQVGTVAAGRIGIAVLRRLHPFSCRLHYTDRHRLSPEVEKAGVDFSKSKDDSASKYTKHNIQNSSDDSDHSNVLTIMLISKCFVELNLTYHETVEDMVKVCDVVTINCPLHSETENLFDR